MIVVMAVVVEVEVVVVVVGDSEVVRTVDVVRAVDVVVVVVVGNATEVVGFNEIFFVIASDNVDDGNVSVAAVINVIVVLGVVVMDVALFLFSSSPSASLEFITCSQARGFVTFCLSSRDLAAA